MPQTTFDRALYKALLGPHLRTLEAPKAINLKQVAQGPLGVGGAPHGAGQGMWGELFGAMTPQGHLQALQDNLIESLLR